MAALPYMQLYVADYLADTMHLSTEEQGAYLLLIMNYWQTGKPIPKSRLSRIARLSNDRWTTVEVSLSEFFNDTGAEWEHKRIDRDLEAVKDSQEQRVRAGKASAEARKRSQQDKSKREGNDRSTTVEVPLQREPNEKATNIDTDIDIDTNTEKDQSATAVCVDPEPVDKPVPPKKIVIDYSSWPEMPDEQILKDWLASRKKSGATHSQTAISSMGKQLHKAVAMGYTVDQCGEEAVTRGWRGFKAEWMNSANTPAIGNQPPGGKEWKPREQLIHENNQQVAKNWAARRMAEDENE